MTFVQRLDCDNSELPAFDPEPDQPIAATWFPPIDPAAIRKEHRIRDAVTAARFRSALIAAIISVTNDLADWRARQQAAGYASLAAIPSDIQIDGKPRAVHLYLRAVALYAKAEIVERYRDIDMSGSGERRADDLEPTPGELRRDAIHAVRDLLGKSRTTVDLI